MTFINEEPTRMKTIRPEVRYLKKVLVDPRLGPEVCMHASGEICVSEAMVCSVRRSEERRVGKECQ